MRDRPRGGHARVLAGRGPARGGGLERGGRGAGGRVPVRARAGHAHRPAGRRGPRSGAGHPGQERAGARAGRPDPRCRPGQDRHADHRRHDRAQGGYGLPAGSSPSPAPAHDEILRLAGAVEDASEHPIGQAVARYAAERLGSLPQVTGFASLPGAGVRGTVDGRVISVGSQRLFGELSVSPRLREAAEAAEEQGRTAVLVGWDGAARAALVIADQLKPHADAAVAWVRDLGLRPVLLTGDNTRAALAVAAQLGIPAADVFAGVRPEGKVEAIRRWQSDGVTVAFVGDGVNDAAALAQADLGMAIGAGTDAAIGAADLTLVSSDPLAIVSAIKLARATMAVIRANLAWASGYNLIAIPLAALGYLNPLFAGIAMSASSLFVVASSLRLRRFHR